MTNTYDWKVQKKKLLRTCKESWQQAWRSSKYMEGLRALRRMGGEPGATKAQLVNHIGTTYKMRGNELLNVVIKTG